MSEQSRTPINGPKESPQYASETTFKPISPATDRKPYTQAISTQYDGSNGRSSSTGRMTTWHGMTAVGRQVQQLMLNRRQQYEDDRQRLDLQYQQDIHQYQNLMNGVGGLVQSTYSSNSIRTMQSAAAIRDQLQIRLNPDVAEQQKKSSVNEERQIRNELRSISELIPKSVENQQNTETNRMTKLATGSTATQGKPQLPEAIQTGIITMFEEQATKLNIWLQRNRKSNTSSSSSSSSSSSNSSNSRPKSKESLIRDLVSKYGGEYKISKSTISRILRDGLRSKNGRPNQYSEKEHVDQLVAIHHAQTNEDMLRRSDIGPDLAIIQAQNRHNMGENANIKQMSRSYMNRQNNLYKHLTISDDNSQVATSTTARDDACNNWGSRAANWYVFMFAITEPFGNKKTPTKKALTLNFDGVGMRITATNANDQPTISLVKDAGLLRKSNNRGGGFFDMFQQWVRFFLLPIGLFCRVVCNNCTFICFLFFKKM
jgi:hypothetical protein|tara:strand:- start:2554 stop:4011 length:1458 start_codon:yes stop_codon:yes gene_type:complete